MLLHPSESELAAVAGLAVDPREMFYDLIVVGGGPAGLGAAVYGASEGLRTVLVEREATGGQAGQSSRIENYLGFPDGVSGGQLAERARRQAVRFGAELLLTRDVVALETHGPKRVVRLDDGRVLAAHAVVLATGISYRSLGVDGVDDLTGRGVYYGSAMTEAVECTDRDIYVVGGANSAGQAAVYLSRFAKSVSLLVRGESLEASMSAYLIEQIAGDREHLRADLLHGRRRAGRRAPGGRHRPGRQHRRAGDPAGEPPVRVHRRRAAHRVAGRVRGPRTSTASSRPARRC